MFSFNSLLFEIKGVLPGTKIDFDLHRNLNSLNKAYRGNKTKLSAKDVSDYSKGLKNEIQRAQQQSLNARIGYQSLINNQPYPDAVRLAQQDIKLIPVVYPTDLRSQIANQVRLSAQRYNISSPVYGSNPRSPFPEGQDIYPDSPRAVTFGSLNDRGRFDSFQGVR